MNVEVTVVKEGNELLFRDAASGLLFDRLDAHFFTGGRLTILRRGRVFDQTDSIEEVGTHAPGPAFCGLDRLFKGKGLLAYQATSLDSAELREGDRLVIRMSKGTPKTFTLADALLEDRHESAVLREIMRRRGGKPISFEQLREEFRAELAKSKPIRPHILRFKEPKEPNVTAT